MFGLSSLSTLGIAVALALSVGFGSGVWVRDAFCDAASEKVRAEAAEAKLRTANLTIKLQQDRIETLNTLRAADAVRAQLDLDAERQNQENINATPQNTTRCLDAAASKRVRSTR